MFTLPTPGDDLGLAAVFPSDGERGGYLALPWPSAYGQSTFFCDGHTVAFVAPTTPDGLGKMKTWLAERGVKSPTIRLCEPTDFVKFTTMANARCSGCDSEQRLRYVAPERYGVDAEQLACPGCGAMFTLASLT
ncbi:MAG: hypothetical protein ACOZQL_04275 [Myxococcota bacterium]